MTSPATSQNSFQLQNRNPPPSCFSISPDRREAQRRSLILRRDLSGRPSKAGRLIASKVVQEALHCGVECAPILIHGAVVHRRARKHVHIEPLMVGGSGRGLMTFVNNQPATKFYINDLSHFVSFLSLVRVPKTETRAEEKQGVGN